MKSNSNENYHRFDLFEYGAVFIQIWGQSWYRFFSFILNAKNKMWIKRYNWIKIGNSIGRIEIHSEKARTTESESALEIQ